MARPKRVIPHPTLTQNTKTKIYEVAWTCPIKGYTKKKSTGCRDRKGAEQALLATVDSIVRSMPPSSDTIDALLSAYEASRDTADTDRRALKKLQELLRPSSRINCLMGPGNPIAGSAPSRRMTTRPAPT